MNWGGYLIWKLPSRLVTIDGRTNLHGEERLGRSLATWAGSRGWDDDPDLGAAKFVLVEVTSPLASLLRRDCRYVVLHEDGQALVCVRKN
jgi:hypothetical protein